MTSWKNDHGHEDVISSYKMGGFSSDRHVSELRGENLVSTVNF